MAKNIGYARSVVVSDEINIQIDKLKMAGCDEVFSDAGKSHPPFGTPALQQALEALNEGDILSVCSLDRLSRNYTQTAAIFQKLAAKNVRLVALDEPEAVDHIQQLINPKAAPKWRKLALSGVMFSLGKFLVTRSRQGITIPRLSAIRRRGH